MKPQFRILFLITIVFCSLTLRAQFDQKKYDKEFFLVGTLNEYMGHQRSYSHGDEFYYQRVDILSKDALNHALFIDSLFSTDYPDITIVNNGAPMGIKIYSPTLSHKMDEYYNYVPSGTFSGQMDTVYSGTLKNDKFVTEKQMMSFILGAYLRYGLNAEIAKLVIQHLKNENLIKTEIESQREMYVLSMPNAQSKATLCKMLLEKLGCENVGFYHRNTIPAGNFVAFTPSDNMMDVINTAGLLKKNIELINTDHVEFTSNGDKYIWREPNIPH